METKEFLKKLNNDYLQLHINYEKYFWESYMWDTSLDEKFNESKNLIDEFKSDENLIKETEKRLNKEKDQESKNRLNYWKEFFNLYQTPEKLKGLKKDITNLETDINEKLNNMDTWYTDLEWNFVKASNSQMSMKISTEKDEKIRKACFEWKEKSAIKLVDEYIKLVKSRNKYAKALWYDDFYDYKSNIEEKIPSKKIFELFDELYDKLKIKFKNIRDMESEKPNIRKPRNLWFELSWNFIKQEDEYYPLENILDYWWKSFTAIWIDYRWWKMKLDLLERKWKYNNWFCHAPVPVHYKNKKRIPWQVNFTCCAIVWQIWSWHRAWNTLFHEWWHAAHFLNFDIEDVCLNTEYPPASTAWDETQSMFLDTMFDSIEWKTRYAKNLKGKLYPWSLHEEKVRKLQKISWRMILGIASVINFEKEIYSCEDLDYDKVIKIAKQNSIKYNDFSEPSLYLLTIPHIYNWESACSYHGYWLAVLALYQWRDYFYKKYGFIVDNPKIWEEMTKVWKYASAKWFEELVKIATWKKLSTKYYLEQVLMNEEEFIEKEKEKINQMEQVPIFDWKINLNAEIMVVDGKKEISNNSNSWEDMTKWFKYFILK